MRKIDRNTDFTQINSLEEKRIRQGEEKKFPVNKLNRVCFPGKNKQGLVDGMNGNTRVGL